MASLVHRFAKKRASLSIGAALRTHLLDKPVPSLFSQQSHPGTLKPELTENPISLVGTTFGEKVEPSKSLHIFPNFPFGYCLKPVSATWIDQLGVRESEEVESDDARTVWADSVKKKRKRKMNKHKYKKLRKKLRRKARA